MAEKKVLIFGLDCATPQFVFDKWVRELPTLSALMKKGIYGPLKSCMPPITIPAWSCMMTSKDPGELGCYGFRNRSDYSYDGLAFATAKAVKEDTVWDILSRQSKNVILLGIPQTYPPRPVHGVMVSCFLTPDTSSQYTYPAEMKEEIRAQVGEYLLDVENFRTDEKGQLLKQIYEMTEKRFKLFSYFLKHKPWDFAMMVEMGIDRIHHGFWKFCDPAHPKYQKANPYENSIRDYYKFVDEKVGEIVARMDDHTVIFVVSDHGAQTMRGGICINEWLIREGYLSIAEKPAGIVPLGKTKIDWKHTKAWGEGGYYSRLFLNMEGREPQGTIPGKDYAKIRDELKAKLEAMTDEKGNSLGTKVFKPEEIYAKTNGVPPDLVVYLGNLAWRSVGSVGLNTIYTFENDTGPDDANHAENGIFIMFDPAGSTGSTGDQRSDLNILDVAPTVLNLLGMSVPHDMKGKIIQ